MKKKSIILNVLIFAIFLTNCSGCIEDQRENDRAEKSISLDLKAEYYVENLSVEKYETVYQSFTPEMKSALPADDLQYAWESLITQYGTFEEIVQIKQKIEQGYQVVYVTCSFSTFGFLDLRFVFDEQQRIAGLQFVPTDLTNQYSSPDYVNTSTFTEETVTIGYSPWQLPATLSIPKGNGSFPAVILIHGSGPNDRDETIGPNKPFKDIAQGLATQGIMVLRYDKRTFAYPEKCVELTNFTPQDEVITDALAAISYVQNRSNVNQSQIYILGHSLGAMMAPEISHQASNLAGVIMLAAPARSFEELYLDQITYLVNLDETIDDYEKEQITAVEHAVQKIKTLNMSKNETVLNLPFSYWKYLSTYDPVATAQNLSLPLFILQGKRDYQVTYEDDFSIWKNSFENSLWVTLQAYQSLNHLFIQGSGKPTNSEYLEPGNVDETVIIDLINWIQEQ